LLEQAVDRYRTVGFGWGMAWAVRLLAATHRAEGNLERAAALYVEGLALARANADRRGLAAGLAGLAEIAASRGDYLAAARLLGTAEDLTGAADVPLRLIVGPEVETAAAAAARDLGAASYAAEVLQGREMALDEAITLAATVASSPGPLAPALRTTPTGDAAGSVGLTAREFDVLRLLVQGRSTQEIADELSVSPRTVTTHVGNILTKMGVNTRAAAVAMALQRKIV
jgi:DNA-binding CsgD family transcriptional regulator